MMRGVSQRGRTPQLWTPRHHWYFAHLPPQQPVAQPQIQTHKQFKLPTLITMTRFPTLHKHPILTIAPLPTLQNHRKHLNPPHPAISPLSATLPPHQVTAHRPLTVPYNPQPPQPPHPLHHHTGQHSNRSHTHNHSEVYMTTTHHSTKKDVSRHHRQQLRSHPHHTNAKDKHPSIQPHPQGTNTHTLPNPSHIPKSPSKNR